MRVTEETDPPGDQGKGQVFYALIQTLDTLEEGAEVAGRLIQAGQLRDGMGTLAELACGLLAACAAHELIDRAGSTASEPRERLRALTKHLVSGLEKGDPVEIADLVRYELPDLLAAWRRELQAAGKHLSGN